MCLSKVIGRRQENKVLRCIACAVRKVTALGLRLLQQVGVQSLVT